MPQRATSESRLEPVRAWLMYGSFPAGFVAVGMMAGTYALFGLAPDPALIALGCCGVFLLYQADRAWIDAPEDRFNQPGRVRWLEEHRAYVVVSSVLAGGGALVLLPGVGTATMWWIAGLGLVGLFEIAPHVFRSRCLQAVWSIKPLVISGAWAVGGVVLPLVDAGAPLDMAAGAAVLYRFLFVLPNVLLADLPDRQGDARAGLQNMASSWSVERLRGTAVLALAVAMAGGLVAFFFFGAPALVLIDLGGPAIMLALVIRPFPASRWYYGFTIDAVVAWPVVTALWAWWG